MSKMETFACKTCPAFYECDKEGIAATAGGYETKVIDGETPFLIVTVFTLVRHRCGEEDNQCSSMRFTAWLRIEARRFPVRRTIPGGYQSGVPEGME